MNKNAGIGEFRSRIVDMLGNSRAFLGVRDLLLKFAMYDAPGQRKVTCHISTCVRAVADVPPATSSIG